MVPPSKNVFDIMLVAFARPQPPHLYFMRLQAFQVANLIREYTEVLQSPQAFKKREGGRKNGMNGSSSRPVSILHKPAPTIEMQTWSEPPGKNQETWTETVTPFRKSLY